MTTPATPLHARQHVPISPETKLIPMSPLSLLLTAVVAAAVVAAVPDVTIPVEPIYNTGGNQCYDERNKPQVGLALRFFYTECPSDIVLL